MAASELVNLSGHGSESAIFGLHKARGSRRPVRARFQIHGCSLREATSLPGSNSLGLKRSQAHMWTAPSSQGVLQCFDQIACVHMSGLLMRSHMSAGQDGFRDKGSKQNGGLREGHWGLRSVPRLGSIDRTICCSSCKFWHQLSTVAGQVLPVSGRSLGRTGRGGGRRRCGVGLPCQHQLPGDARHLVGQRYGGQLRRLALE